MPRQLTLSDYLGITFPSALAQWRAIRERRTPGPGRRQDAFEPVETLLCLAAMYLVEWSRYGSVSAGRAPSPVPELARLFRRPPTSVIAKMGNLDGAREHGARFDRLVAGELRDDTARLAEIYRAVLRGARAAGVGIGELPDFLGLEHGGTLHLLGQDELTEAGSVSTIEREIEDRLRREHDLSERETERIVLGSVRVGQHRFARGVLDNCGEACVFCGFVVRDAPPSGMLRASHVKPWRDSSHRERLDIANGLAACPTHDAAFDGGLLTVAADLTIVQSSKLLSARATNAVVEQFFATPPLGPRITLPRHAVTIDAAYLNWHKGRVFVQ